MSLVRANQTKGLLSTPKVIACWVAGSLLLQFLFLTTARMNESWCEGLRVGFCAGHLLLAIAVGWRRLSIEFPVDRRWLDALTIFGAAGVGPIAWYFEWRDVQEMGPAASEKPARSPSRARLFWLILLALGLASALAYWRYRIGA